jgi:hypothetical protein
MSDLQELELLKDPSHNDIPDYLEDEHSDENIEIEQIH